MEGFNFKVTRILGGKVDFHYSVFGDCDIMFERTEFGNSRVDFRTVDFWFWQDKLQQVSIW